MNTTLILQSGFRILSSSLTSLNYRNNGCPCINSCSKTIPSLHSQRGSPWSASEIAESVKGKIIKWAPPGTICTDTRNLQHGEWFFAIAGPNFDGHDFVDSALDRKGCVGVIGNRVCENWQNGFIKVEGDTLMALKKMASFARKRFHGYVVGLTGSVGKTTTRSMIALALESLGQVYQTCGNQNNQIGVALTLIGIPLNANASVLELGMSGRGEILELAQMCCPSVRVILNVGHCHMENFESLEEVARAKGELLIEAKPGDICVLNADDPMVTTIPVPSGVKKILFGQRTDCDVRLVFAESTDEGGAIRVILEHKEGGEKDQLSAEWVAEIVEFKIRAPGLHLGLNACAAAAVAVSLGVSLNQAGESLSRFSPIYMRSEIESAQNGTRVINDAYNANPASMRTAINLLKSMSCRGKRVAVLGDMLELGAMEARFHEEVLDMCCCDSCFDLVVLVGSRFLAACKNLNLLRKTTIRWAPNSQSAAVGIAEWLTADDVVLVKGSRTMQMEKVVDAIKAVSS